MPSRKITDFNPQELAEELHKKRKQSQTPQPRPKSHAGWSAEDFPQEAPPRQ